MSASPMASERTGFSAFERRRWALRRPLRKSRSTYTRPARHQLLVVGLVLR